MNPYRRKILASTPLLLAAAALPRPMLAQDTKPVAGKEYRLISPAQPADSKTQIEVLEFFSYGCPHCFAFEPAIEPWIAKLPPVVAFHRVPVTFNQAWIPLARAYYTLEILGEVPRMHQRMFAAVHQERLRLNTDVAVVDFLEKNGIPRKKITDAYNSFTMQSKITRVGALLAAYNIDAVPEMAVDGRYLAANTMVGGSHEAVLPVVDYLIAESKKARKL